MSQSKAAASKDNGAGSALAKIAGGVLFLGVLAALALISQLPAAGATTRTLAWLFNLSSSQTTWYITRAAGLTSYVLIWLSVVWGLAIPSKIFDRFIKGNFSYDFHEFLSLAAIGFVLLHMGALLFDGYMPYSLTQLLVPFLSPYRPLWVGIGVIGLYLSLLVTVTFYLRSRIGMKAFRVIHYFSLLSYLGVTVHGFLAGTDTSLLSVMGLYASTLLVVVFLTVYWIVIGMLKSAEKRRAVVQAAPAAARAVARQTASRF
jgi:sulfoxide reductase heme-binding subunit YedZ